jgi:hypothetical protein
MMIRMHATFWRRVPSRPVRRFLASEEILNLLTGVRRFLLTERASLLRRCATTTHPLLPRLLSRRLTKDLTNLHKSNIVTPHHLYHSSGSDQVTICFLPILLKASKPSSIKVQERSFKSLSRAFSVSIEAAWLRSWLTTNFLRS